MSKPQIWLGALITFLVSLAPELGAQETGPQVTTSAGWTFATNDKARGDATWSTGETAFVGLTARWGNALELAGTVKSDFSGAPLTADSVLEKLAITWTANPFTILTAGKQRLSWGTARVFSAIDSLEPALDPTDLSATPRGVTGLKVELIPLDWLSVWALALPAARLDDSVVATRLDILWEEADLSVGAARSVSRPLTGVTPTALVRDRRESPVFFADFARFFDRFGLYGEAQVRQGRQRDWFIGTLKDLDASGPWTVRATGGVQVEFPVWLNGTLRWLNEYHFNGEGFTDDEANDFAKAWPQRGSTSALPRGLAVGAYRRHYLYSGLSGLPLAEKVTAGASVLGSLEGLVLFSTQVYWEIGPSLGVRVAYDRFEAWNSKPDQSELLFLPYKNKVSASVSAWY